MTQNSASKRFNDLIRVLIKHVKVKEAEKTDSHRNEYRRNNEKYYRAAYGLIKYLRK